MKVSFCPAKKKSRSRSAEKIDLAEKEFRSWMRNKNSRLMAAKPFGEDAK
jgi:hypothetical protein